MIFSYVMPTFLSVCINAEKAVAKTAFLHPHNRGYI